MGKVAVLTIEEYSERYIKPVVHSNPEGCVALLKECDMWGRCINCKSWTKSDGYLDYGNCKQVQCEFNILVSSDGKSLLQPSGLPYMFYFDPSQEQLGFFTREDFGCVLFQERKTLVKKAAD